MDLAPSSSRPHKLPKHQAHWQRARRYLDTSCALRVIPIRFCLFNGFYVMPQLNKNGHLLPTGQWYALSAVINDAMIMPEYARVCQSMPEYARVCQSMQE